MASMHTFKIIYLWNYIFTGNRSDGKSVCIVCEIIFHPEALNIFLNSTSVLKSNSRDYLVTLLSCSSIMAFLLLIFSLIIRYPSVFKLFVLSLIRNAHKSSIILTQNVTVIQIRQNPLTPDDIIFIDPIKQHKALHMYISYPIIQI